MMLAIARDEGGQEQEILAMFFCICASIKNFFWFQICQIFFFFFVPLSLSPPPSPLIDSGGTAEEDECRLSD